MIQHLDNMLRHLFLARPGEIKVGFGPPDDDWRTGLGEQNALNVYLAELRENRKLRSNERIREIQRDIANDKVIVNETPAPRRVDCHYLITAWSPVTVTRGTEEVEPTLDEHELLAQVTAVLIQKDSLIPRKVYRDALPDNFPEEVADAELPIQVLPVEGFPKLAEFWGTMGVNHRWKPAVYLVVTIPIVPLLTEEAETMVTTRRTEYKQTGRPETAEVWIEIGGHVFSLEEEEDEVPVRVPVPGAWVRLEEIPEDPAETPTPVQEPTITDTEGRFKFARLHEGDYTLRVRAQGFEPFEGGITVPSPSGNYDVSLKVLA